MKHNEKLIERLLKLWYELIGGDHHKDRDCWFFIEREYCTYQEPSWNLRHNGYILSDYTQSFDTFEKAQQGLIELLMESCAKEIDSIRKNPDEFAPTRNVEYADKKLSELGEIVQDQYYIAESELKSM
jgi:hypothetical protein